MSMIHYLHMYRKDGDNVTDQLGAWVNQHPILKTNWMTWQLRIVTTTTSTQHELITWLNKGGGEGAVVLAEEQTKGRARQGRSWYSPPGKGIWMSIALQPQLSQQLLPQLTLLIAVAVCQAIHKVTNLQPDIKWPNDILVNDKKVCGILLEVTNEQPDYVIIGIGISVNLDKIDYSAELYDVATSLQIVMGHPIDRVSLAVQCLYELERLYLQYKQHGFTPIRLLWEAQSITVGRRVVISMPSHTVSGIAQRLNEIGALVIQDETGCEQHIFTGDLHFKDKTTLQEMNGENE